MVDRYNAFFELLMKDDLISPIAFVIFGLVGLVWFQVLKLFSKDFLAKNVDHPIFRRTFQNFESRTRLSWLLVIFGVVWLVQALLQSSWAA